MTTSNRLRVGFIGANGAKAGLTEIQKVARKLPAGATATRQ